MLSPDIPARDIPRFIRAPAFKPQASKSIYLPPARALDLRHAPPFRSRRSLALLPSSHAPLPTSFEGGDWVPPLLASATTRLPSLSMTAARDSGVESGVIDDVDSPDASGVLFQRLPFSASRAFEVKSGHLVAGAARRSFKEDFPIRARACLVYRHRGAQGKHLN